MARTEISKNPRINLGNFCHKKAALFPTAWDRVRRFVVVREQVRETRRSLGRKLLDVPGYTFRVFVTNPRERTGTKARSPWCLWQTAPSAT